MAYEPLPRIPLDELTGDELAEIYHRLDILQEDRDALKERLEEAEAVLLHLTGTTRVVTARYWKNYTEESRNE